MKKTGPSKKVRARRSPDTAGPTRGGNKLNKKELRAFAGALRAFYGAAFVAAAVSEAHRLSEGGRLKNSAIWDQIVREMEQVDASLRDAR